MARPRSIRRRFRERVQSTVAVAASVAVTLAAGCGGGSERAPGSGRASMTEKEYVSHVAALTVAAEEGLHGERALARARELGGGDYARDEIEAFARRLKTEPARWVELEKEVDARAAEIRGTTRGPRPRRERDDAAPEPSGKP